MLPLSSAYSFPQVMTHTSVQNKKENNQCVRSIIQNYIIDYLPVISVCIISNAGSVDANVYYDQCRKVALLELLWVGSSRI